MRDGEQVTRYWMYTEVSGRGALDMTDSSMPDGQY